MTIDVILFEGKTLSDGSHPVVLRLTEKGKRKYRTLGREYTFKKSEWDYKKRLPKRDPDGSLEKYITDIKKKYTDKLRELKADEVVVSMDRLIELVEKPTTKTTVFEYFDHLIENFKAVGRVGNASIYKSCKVYLKKFHPKDLYFQEINYSFLNGWELFLRKMNLADTTIAIQFRTLRAAFTEAIKDENINLEEKDYPFKKFSISKNFDIETQKRALSEKDIIKIKELNLSPEHEYFEAWQYFMFSYYALGMAFVDVAHLTWGNIDLEEEIITYSRHKKRKKGKPFNIPMLPEAKRIILQQAQKTDSFNKRNYIFPILNKDIHITPQQQSDRVHKVLTQVNKGLKGIALLANIDAHLTSYVSRHSMASELQRKDVSIDVIKELMDHRNTQTTETYLKGLSIKVKRNAAMNL